MNKYEHRDRSLAREKAGLIPDYSKSVNGSITVSLPFVPCNDEGAVIEWCHTCGGEGKHVRECLHDENPTGKCTRSYVSDKVWSCSNCPYRRINKD